MKKYAIPLALSALLLAGITACNRSSPSATASQSDSSQPSATSAQGSSQDNRTQAAPTPEQLKRREEVRKQIETVLTPDQTKLLETKVQQGEPMRKALNELNLTDDQKAKIRDIRKAAYANHKKSNQNQGSNQGSSQ